jgi:DNA-binding NtrC family response regulator
MKILLSWIGFREDFSSNNDHIVVNPNGFSVALHRDIIDQMGFDKHIILCTTDLSGKISLELTRKMGLLRLFIDDQFPRHHFDFVNTGIDKSDLQDFKVIESALRSLIQTFDLTDDLHVVAGTGPTAVGMAWCTLSLVMDKRFSLHVLQRPEYVHGSRISLLKKIDPFVSRLLDDKLKEGHLRTDLPDGIFADEEVVAEYRKAFTYAQSSEMNVLILGETGCGKDRMAEYIFQNSPLADRKYKAINCASLPDDVLYSELFGHVKGAFTGAEQHRIGVFEECSGGTLFLDEIGDISPYMQQSLLRALEKGEIKMLGSNEIKKNVKVRVIAATNANLYQKCKDGQYRWDLYYRLSNPEIFLEPYRSRPKEKRRDIIKHYLGLLEKKWNRPLEITPEAQKIIEEYSFPGNFREIHNTLNALFPLRLGKIDVADLPARFLMEENRNDESYDFALKSHCNKIYKRYGYDLKATKKALGYGNITQVKKKFQEWGILIQKPE